MLPLWNKRRFTPKARFIRTTSIASIRLRVTRITILPKMLAHRTLAITNVLSRIRAHIWISSHNPNFRPDKMIRLASPIISGSSRGPIFKFNSLIRILRINTKIRISVKRKIFRIGRMKKKLMTGNHPKK